MSDRAPDPPPDLPDGLSPSSIANFPFAVVMSDPRQDDCPIVYVNAEFTRVTGYPAGQAIGRNCRFLQGEDTDPAQRAAIATALTAGEPVSVDIVNHRADGAPFVNRLMISPLREDDGALVYFIGLLSDMSDGHATSDEARELRERLRELQHRVKNHLAMILAMIRLEARGRSADEVVDLLTQRVQALSLLYDSFSSHEDGSSERVPLGAYLGRLTASFLDLDGRAGLRIDTDMADLQVDIEDAGRLGLFVSEVLTNALRHGLSDRDEGTVRVALDVGDGKAVLSITDDGRGMGDAIWPGERSVGSRIVRDLCERIGGTLDVSSDGDGTAIRLRFPTR